MNFLTTPGKRLFLTGDEAVARAALESGVDIVTGYPGNPSTKTITALLPLAKTYNMTVEWSVNEKVALEVAAGAAWAGKRSLVTMKMSGINVMADSLLSIAHSGVRGALVVYAVDDVGTYYGMVEQDSRHYARLTSLPLLMPASPEEAYALTLLAFQISQTTGAPVFLLATTAVANAITTMKVGKLEQRPASSPAHFERDLAKFTKATPQWCLEQHADALRRLEHAGELCAQATGVNRIIPAASGQARLGIVVAGVSATYVEELRQRDLARYGDIAVLKIGQVHPLPHQLLREFLGTLERVLVLEELDPLIETEVLAELAEMGHFAVVLGKRRGDLPRVGDYSVELVAHALEALLAGSEDGLLDNLTVQVGEERQRPAQTLLPMARALEFCPGCPHRMSYYALNQAIERLGFARDEVITTGDIGCTIIGMNAPLETCWTEVSMGASIGIAQGLKQAGIEKPILAAMGDGTFYHNGIAGLLNAVQAGVNLTLLILDNSRSAMTGMQPDAGTGQRFDGEPNVRADIALLARGCGVASIRRIDPYQLETMIETLREAMLYPGVSVVIAEAPCTTQGILIRPQQVQVDQQACLAGRGCVDTPCYSKVGCPSVLLSLDDLQPRLSIDTATCVACGLCVSACPFEAIKPIAIEEQAVLSSVALKHVLQD
ncbi:MAG: indolepyruvate ferredoxin oxidoreductase subunit alpha [Ktedonobacteraceae bacterium]